MSEILGVESVAAESIIPRVPTTSIDNDYLGSAPVNNIKARPWWKEVGDYLEDPHRHFQLMDSLRTDMDWPEYIKNAN